MCVQFLSGRPAFGCSTGQMAPPAALFDHVVVALFLLLAVSWKWAVFDDLFPGDAVLDPLSSIPFGLVEEKTEERLSWALASVDRCDSAGKAFARWRRPQAHVFFLPLLLASATDKRSKKEKRKETSV